MFDTLIRLIAMLPLLLLALAWLGLIVGAPVLCWLVIKENKL